MSLITVINSTYIYLRVQGLIYIHVQEGENIQRTPRGI
jgi:hypothetical protein